MLVTVTTVGAVAPLAAVLASKVVGPAEICSTTVHGCYDGSCDGIGLSGHWQHSVLVVATGKHSSWVVCRASAAVRMPLTVEGSNSTEQVTESH